MAAQILNLGFLQPLCDSFACFVKGKETGRDFEYAPFLCTLLVHEWNKMTVVAEREN